MYFPRYVALGHDAVLKAGEMCDALGFNGAGVMITGKDTYPVAGKAVMDMLSDKRDISLHVTGAANEENVEKACEAVDEAGAKYILAVGGGSKIDISKKVASDKGIPFASIPTSVAHDGIASDRASIKTGSGPESVAAVSPSGIIADTGIISAARYEYLAAGCADVISNLTAIKDWELAYRMRQEREFSSSACILAQYAADNIVSNSAQISAGREDSVWMIMRPIISSGISMCVAGSSRPTSGSEHMFSHALDDLFPGRALHGAQCGVGTIMMMCHQGGDWKIVLDALKAIKAPTTAEELGFEDHEIVEALMRAQTIRKDRFTILSHKPLSERAARSLARKTGVIGDRRPRGHRPKAAQGPPE